ncbi:MAG: WD40 repeat domain-containing serine/threonine-protein kinase [Pirellulales bacterium]
MNTPSSMPQGDNQIDAELDLIVEQFLTRRRGGESVSIAQFAAGFPRHERRLLDLLPMIQRLEQLVPETDHRAVNHQADKAGVDKASPIQMPSRLGEYRLLSIIGEGGMGIVYEAYHERLRRTVALKTLRPEFRADRRLAQRFHQEAVAAGNLHHPHIVPIYEIGADGEIEYLAMQYVSGETLSAIIREIAGVRRQPNGPGSSVSEPLANWTQDQGKDRGAEVRSEPERLVPAGSTVAPGAPSSWTPDQLRSELTGLKYFRRVARMMADVADAVQAAHDRNVIHRDIKPSNLMIDRQCKIWVTDFGLAKVQGSDLSRTHDVIGTIRYMSPEQLRGQADPRSDVYALGATTYEFLTLQPAFAGNDFGELVQAIVDGRAQRLRTVDARIPRDLETIVHKAMATDRAQRYATAAELRDDLERFAGMRPIQARRASPVHQLVSWARRQPLAATAVGLACLLIAGWLITVQVYNVSLGRTAAALALRQAISALSSGEVGGVQDLMGQFRSFSSANLGEFVEKNRDQSSLMIDGPFRHAVMEVGWTPSGDLLVMDFLGDLACIRLPDRKELWRFPQIRPREGGDISINQSYNELVMHTRDNQLVRIDLATGKSKPLEDPKAMDAVRPVYGGEGKYLAEASYGNYRVWDVETGRIIHRGTFPPGAYCPRAYQFGGDDGELLEYGSDSGDWVQWDWRNQKIVARHPPLPNHNWVYRGRKVGWLSSGRNNTEATDIDLNVNVIELSSQKILWSTQVTRHGLWTMAASPDETRFALPTVGGVVEVYDVVEREKRAWIGHTGKIRAVAWDFEGKRLASGGLDRTVRIWDWDSPSPVASWQSTVRPVSRWEGVLEPVLTADQKYLLVYGKDTLRIVKRDTLEFIATLHPTANEIASLDVSPDSRAAAVGTRAGEVFVFEIATGRQLARLQITPCEVNLFFSHDPHLLAVLSENGECRLWNWTQPEAKVVYKDRDMLMAVSFDRENRNMIVGGIGGQLWLIDLQGEREPRIWDRPGISVRTLECSPDFKWLACTGVTNQVRLYHVEGHDFRRNGPPPYRDLPTPAGGDSGLRWSQSGDLLWTGNGRQLQAWNPVGNQPVVTFSGYLIPDAIHRPLPVGERQATEVIAYTAEHRVVHLSLDGSQWTPEFRRHKRIYSRLAWLFEQYELTKEVVDVLAKDTLLDSSEQAAAIELAWKWHESPYELLEKCEMTVHQRGLPRERYQRALELAERLVELWPDQGQGLNVRAAALCRLDDHQAALPALEAARQRLAVEPVPDASHIYSSEQRRRQLQHLVTNQIFTAMSRQALGNTEESRASLQQALADWRRDFGDIIPVMNDDVVALSEPHQDVPSPPNP